MSKPVKKLDAKPGAMTVEAKQPERRIEYMRLSEVRPASKNPKSHDVGQIASSIGRFGYIEPVVMDERTGRLVAGHGRVKTVAEMQKKGQTPPEGVRLEGKEWLVPVLRGWASRTDEDAQAYLVASNQLTTLGGWDDAQLADVLKDLAAAGALEGTGFDGDDVDELLKQVLPAGPVPGEDDAPEVPAESWVKPGDLFELGAHRLLCGDSTKAEDVARVLSGEKDLVCFTSPPYGDAREYGGDKDLAISSLAGIFEAAPQVATWCLNLGILRREGEVWTYWDEWIARARVTGLKLVSWNVWSREGMGGSVGAMTAPFAIEHEFIFVFGREAPRLVPTLPTKYAGLVKPGTSRQSDGSVTDNIVTIGTAKRLGTVLTLSQEKSRNGDTGDHPAVFPVALPVAYLTALAPEVVFEPFSGSGSTLIACEQIGVPCCAVDLEPRYVQVAIERWETFTGKKHRKLEPAP